MEEIYKVKREETRLNEIAKESLSFRTGLQEVSKKVQIHLNWVEANSTFPEPLPQKTTGGLKIELTPWNSTENIM